MGLYCEKFTGLLEQGAPLVWLASASHSSRVAAEVAAGHCDIEALVIAAPRETRKVPAKFAGRFAPGTLAAAWAAMARVPGRLAEVSFVWRRTCSCEFYGRNPP